MRSRHDLSAAFHERAAMEDAVHELVDRGIRASDIRVAQAKIVDGRVQKAPEGGARLTLGLALGAVVGAALALLWMLGLRRAGLVEVPLPWIALRMLGGAASGALFGALVAVLFTALVRGRRGAPRAAGRDFVVTVTSPDAADEVKGVLTARGGQLVPA